MTTPTIRLFRSTDTGAPSLSGTAGALIALLDACLKDGYNSKAVQSITRSGSTATVTFATAHGFASDGLTIVRVAGADQAEYNGDFQISNVTSTAFDITVSGTPATPATGTITAKVAPLDWEKAFSGTNKAAYRSADTTGTRMYLRVDDNNPNADSYKNAFLRGYESMSDVDTGTGLFPTIAQLANGIYLTKSNTSDSTARSWVLAGDGLEFILFSAHGINGFNIHSAFHFGDFSSELDSDPYGCLIFGQYGSQVGDWATGNQVTFQFVTNPGFNNVQSGHFLARAYTQTGTAVACGKHGDYMAAGSMNFGRGSVPYPSPHNSGLYVGSILIGEPTIPRGVLRCIYAPWHTAPLGHGNKVAGLSNLDGRTLYAVATAYSGTTAGETHIDITGPWR
jgi:hypothetical protein